MEGDFIHTSDNREQPEVCVLLFDTLLQTKRTLIQNEGLPRPNV